MFSWLSRRGVPASDLLTSQLYNEQTFYRTLMRDMNDCISEAVIESPFLTVNRVAGLLPIFKKMRSRNVRIVVNTRPPHEHEAPYDAQAAQVIERLQNIGVEVLLTGKLHRKLAIFDRQILYEGSLNILSQNDSCEIMRRTCSQVLVQQMVDHTRLAKFLER